jgi:Uma2 family endonuclease
MTAGTEARVTYEEYLQIERDTGIKHEFDAGRITAMTGGSPNHALISANTIRALGNLLHTSPCRAYSPDLRIFVASLDQVFYPDASVVCGDRQMAAHDANAIENPALVAEVMSPSSRDKDQGTKSLAYRQLPSVQEILLIDSEARIVIHQQRQDDGSWRLTEHRGDDPLPLALGVTLTLDELYDGTGL